MSIRRAQDERIEGTPDGLATVSEIMDFPDAPTAVVATNAPSGRPYNNGAATVAITAAVTGGTPATYTVISTPGSFTGTGTSPVTVTGLQSQTSYTFKATGVTSTNVTGIQSDNSNSITASTAPEAPTIGTPTVATGQSYTGNANVSVPFTAGATGGSAITGYTVTSSSGGTATGSSSPIVISDVVGTARTYTVTATNANGTSSASSASASTTPSSIPQAPTIGAVSSGGSGIASVAFTPGATGGSAITGYTVTSSPGGLTGTGASSPVNVSGLTTGTAYTFTVTATNANGTSAASSASSSYTPAIQYTLIGTYNSTTNSIQINYPYLAVAAIGAASGGFAGIGSSSASPAACGGSGSGGVGMASGWIYMAKDIPVSSGNTYASVAIGAGGNGGTGSNNRSAPSTTIGNFGGATSLNLTGYSPSTVLNISTGNIVNGNAQSPGSNIGAYVVYSSGASGGAGGAGKGDYGAGSVGGAGSTVTGNMTLGGVGTVTATAGSGGGGGGGGYSCGGPNYPSYAGGTAGTNGSAGGASGTAGGANYVGASSASASSPGGGPGGGGGAGSKRGVGCGKGGNAGNGGAGQIRLYGGS